MDTSKSNETIHVTRNEWLQETIEDHLQCVLCGTALDFKHKTDFIGGVVHEEAHCPACRIRNRQTSHKLQ